MKRAVVLTGLVRDENKFISFLDAHLARPQYTDIPIYFSTWAGELEKYPEVATRLAKLNAIVVEQNQPDLILPGHALHQMVAWDLPLGLLNEDVFVFKSRPDFADYGLFERFVGYKPILTSSSTPYGALPKYRFLIASTCLPQPFYINDITFAGMAGDLRRLTKLSLLDMVRYLRLGPEQLIWAPQFIRPGTPLDVYFRGNAGLIFNDEKKSLKSIERLKKYTSYIYSLAYYFLIIGDAFDFFEIDNSSSLPERIRDYSVEELLWSPLELPFLAYHSNCVMNRTNLKNYVTAIVNGLCKPSKLLEDIRQAIGEIQNNNALSFDDLTREAEEYDFFCATELDIHGSKVIRQRPGGIFCAGAAAAWHQANLGTSATAKLEAEINQLRRTIDLLETQINLSKKSAVPS